MAEEWESSKVYPRVVTTLSSLLQRVVEINESSSSSTTTKPLLSVWTTTNNGDEAKEEEEEEKKKNSSVFQGVRKPGISIKKYLERIFKYAGCSPACFVVAYVYLDRFTRHCPNLSIDSFNVHRLLITTVLLATKFLDDMLVLSISFLLWRMVTFNFSSFTLLLLLLHSPSFRTFHSFLLSHDYFCLFLSLWIVGQYNVWEPSFSFPTSSLPLFFFFANCITLDCVRTFSSPSL